jgi:integrase
MSVRKDIRDGTWRYRVIVKPPNGKGIRISGTPQINTKVAAEIAEREHIQRVLSPPPSPTVSPAKEVPYFGEFADEFMETYVAANNKPSERHSKKGILSIHLRPAFGLKRLDEISVREIEQLKAKLLKKELSPKRINNILAVLSKILSYAREVEVLESMPAVRLLRLPPAKFDFLTFEELELLVTAGEPEPEWRTAILVGAEAGLRMGEIIALEWEDIDLRKRELKVMRSSWHGQVTSPKSGRSRTIPLTERLSAALKGHRHLRGARIFCGPGGEPWTRHLMRKRLYRIYKRAGLRIMGWHVLRHTFCSHLAMRGAAPKAIQELAGHTTLTMTMRYMHLAPAALREAISLLDSRSPWQPGGNNSAVV